MKLSILIPTLPMRKNLLDDLLANINKQCGSRDDVEVLFDRRPPPITTGEKRNALLETAIGEYTWFIDDDDTISPNAIELVLKAAETSPDVIGINGYMTTDGKNRVDWEIRLGYKYEAVKKDGKEYYHRFPNHITPMRRQLASMVKFQHISQMEDYRWAKELNDRGLLKTQVVIEEPIYHYKYLTRK